MSQRVRLSIAFAALWALSSFGCGGVKPPDLYAVSGKVTYQGQPVPGAKLVFIPEKEDLKSQPLTRAGGETDEQGNFEMTWGDDQLVGSPAGSFKVAVYAYEEVGEDHDDEIKPASLIPERYNSPATSGLTATVKQNGENVINFDLAP